MNSSAEESVFSDELHQAEDKQEETFITGIVPAMKMGTVVSSTETEAWADADMCDHSNDCSHA